MAEATSEQQGANSPARQLLAALTRASQEMEKSVSESYDYVSKLNLELERVVNAQLDETAEKTELYVRGHQSGISTEKEQILSMLTELRQEELKVLQATGRNLRLAIVEKLDGLVNGFKTDVDNHLQSFQTRLDATETENAYVIENARELLQMQIPEFLQSINDEVGKEKESMESLHDTYVTMLNQESTVSLTQLKEHSAELKARLDAEGEEFISSVEASSQTLISVQTEKLNDQIQAFSEFEQLAEQRITSLTENDIAYVNELPKNFSHTCEQMAELQVGLHATIVKNLALQYRTEILSAAQEAEDHLQIVRGDLQSMMRQYQNSYSEQFEGLLNKFEKVANDIAQSQDTSNEQAASTEQIIAAIQEQFANVKKIIAESAREKVSDTENAMEKSYEEFRLRLEGARKAATDNIELSFKQNQDELAKLQQTNEDNLQELSAKVDELEQAVNEAKELIRALDQASLDF